MAAEAIDPRSDDLVLELERSGVCGTDLVKLRRRTAVGSVLGHEVVGRVVEGPAEWLGERVALAHHAGCGACRWCQRDLEPHCAAYRENLLDPGGFASRLRVRARAVRGGSARRVPADLPSDAALFFEPLACTVRGLRRGGLLDGPGGARAAIHGAGATGLLHLLAIRCLRPEVEITVVEPRPERRALALELGASRALDPAQQGEPGLVDLVVEASGAAASAVSGASRLEPGGSLVLFAHGPEGALVETSTAALFAGERRIVGSYSSGAGDRDLAWRLLVGDEACRLDPRPLIDRPAPLPNGPSELERALRGETLKLVFHGEHA